MRNAAMVLGIIGGLIAMVIGFFGYGYTEVVARHEEVGEVLGQFNNAGFVRAASFAAPLLGLAGGAMAKMRALWGGALMLLAAGLVFYAFGFNVFTMFAIGFLGLGGVLALAAFKPDQPHSHF